jgi:ribitol-5-phosphate 2-dehydrogenase
MHLGGWYRNRLIRFSLGRIDADLRFYTGQRRPEALARKLPMSLIHKGIGTVLVSKADIQAGERVIVPNLPGYLLDGIAPEDCCPAI